MSSVSGTMKNWVTSEEEWRNGGMEEWRNGGMEEWRDGRMERCCTYLYKTKGEDLVGGVAGVVPLAPPVIHHGRERAVVGVGCSWRSITI